MIELMIELTEAIKILKQGGIVIYPTDTAFGIGCRMDDSIAVARLFKIRKRPVSQATPVLVDSIGMAQKYLLSPLPTNVRHLMGRYWPGALTVIYPCRKDLVPPLVRGNGKNLGVRMPNHETALALIKGVGVPILGPSANFHGQPTPYSYAELDEELVKLADGVISGECKTGNVSTVVDCSLIHWKTIRQGAIKIDKGDIV
ncbi:threonylcarbamoyl-AMP synthase [Candidatus Gottesmanbacteria bacterium]|nr:threonylcarbamoyl-AMP synthase [Candidatus Gottesmanbacteria bacterium]MBI5452217.1 threonylcarbamoyl-AMP synthase [Candidatus Gottesmanbacteria bacterium]